jgi:hypothetical protein
MLWSEGGYSTYSIYHTLTSYKTIVFKVTRRIQNEYTQEERKAFINTILAKYHTDFEYKASCEMANNKGIDRNNIVKVRLDILATYLLRVDIEYRKTILTRYKEVKRPQQEVPFWQFSA